MWGRASSRPLSLSESLSGLGSFHLNLTVNGTARQERSARPQGMNVAKSDERTSLTFFSSRGLTGSCQLV